MTYHQFLREVWKAANRGRSHITGDEFDKAIFPALRRLRPDLWDKINTVKSRQECDPRSIVSVLRYLEIHWAGTPTQQPQEEPQ